MSRRLWGGMAALTLMCCGFSGGLSCAERPSQKLQPYGRAAAAPPPPPVIVLDHSIGGIAYHDTPATVERKLGGGRVVLRIPGGRQIQYPYDIKVLYRRGRGAWLAMQVETRSARYRTVQGVGIGSTRKAVKVIPMVQCDPTGCDRSTLPNGAGMGTTFQFDSRGRVNWIAIGNTAG
jgi:hypothetical protein